jgi:hypothetical protein
MEFRRAEACRQRDQLCHSKEHHTLGIQGYDFQIRTRRYVVNSSIEPEMQAAVGAHDDLESLRPKNII